MCDQSLYYIVLRCFLLLLTFIMYALTACDVSFPFLGTTNTLCNTHYCRLTNAIIVRTMLLVNALVS